MLFTILNTAAYIGMALSAIGTRYQKDLNMKVAFKWFLAADLFLIGLQVYLGAHGAWGAWAVVSLYLIYFYMSAVGLMNANKQSALTEDSDLPDWLKDMRVYVRANEESEWTEITGTEAPGSIPPAAPRYDVVRVNGLPLARPEPTEFR